MLEKGHAIENHTVSYMTLIARKTTQYSSVAQVYAWFSET